MKGSLGPAAALMVTPAQPPGTVRGSQREGDQGPRSSVFQPEGQSWATQRLAFQSEERSTPLVTRVKINSSGCTCPPLLEASHPGPELAIRFLPNTPPQHHPFHIHTVSQPCPWSFTFMKLCGLHPGPQQWHPRADLHRVAKTGHAHRSGHHCTGLYLEGE